MRVVGARGHAWMGSPMRDVMLEDNGGLGRRPEKGHVQCLWWRDLLPSPHPTRSSPKYPDFFFMDIHHISSSASEKKIL